MKLSDPSKIQQAQKAFKKRFTFKDFKAIPKYRNCKRKEYVKYLQNIESLALLLLESYIFNQRNKQQGNGF